MKNGILLSLYQSNYSKAIQLMEEYFILLEKTYSPEGIFKSNIIPCMMFCYARVASNFSAYEMLKSYHHYYNNAIENKVIPNNDGKMYNVVSEILRRILSGKINDALILKFTESHLSA